MDKGFLTAVQVILTSAIGMFGVAMGLEGYFKGHIHWVLRILCMAGGLLLIYPGWATDIAGVVLVGGIVVLQLFMNKNKAQPTAAA